MMRTLAHAAAFALAATLVVTASARQLTPETVYRAYASGDDLAVERWVATLPPGESPFGTLDELRSRAPWNRVAAAFLLEVAAANPASSRAVSALSRGREMVIRRPAALGTHPEEDRFEILWHQAALGIAQHHHAVLTQDDYLMEVLPRFEDAERRGVGFKTRLPLARAITAALMCCDGPPRSAGRRSSTGQLLELPTIDTAVKYFDAAARQDDLRPEALIRNAKLLHDSGRHEEALRRLDQVPVEGVPALGYVHHLTHAGVLDALQRPQDAIREYERALAVLPDGQLAAIGLAAANLRAGHADDAARTAEAARRMPPVPGRGFREFESVDYRFVPQWLAEIRKLRR